MHKSTKTKLSWLDKTNKGGMIEVSLENKTHFYVCSNHFVDGKPTTENPIPSLFLMLAENQNRALLKTQTECVEEICYI